MGVLYHEASNWRIGAKPLWSRCLCCKINTDLCFCWY